MTFEEYNSKNGNKFKLATEEEIDVYFQEHRNSLISDFTEITEERFDDLLNCLPPKRWHTCYDVEIFFMSECYTADLYTCCGSYNGKFFSALRSIREESPSISTAVKTAYEKLTEASIQ